MGKCATPRVTRNSRGLRASSTEPEGTPATPLRRSSRLSNTSIAPSTPPNRVTKTRKNNRPKRASNFETAVATQLSPIFDAGEQPNPTVISEEEPIPTIPLDDEPKPVITSENEPKPIIPTEDEPNSTITSEDEPKIIIPSEDEPNTTIPSEDEPKPTVSSPDEDDFSPLFAYSPIRSTTIQEDVSHETEKFTAHKKEEGHRFGRKLYNTIQTEHEKRGCECGLPIIYATLEEAKAGEGTFRFYYKDDDADWVYKKVWVFMRKDDRRWHYQCDAQYLSDFACWVRKEKKDKEAEQNRKRKAEEDAQQELEQFRARVVARLVEPGVNRWDHWRSVNSMYKTFANKISTMGESLKGFLRNLRDGVNITTQPTHEALESRHLDETGTHLVVKRFKRQFTRPVAVTRTMDEDPSSDFDLLPYFKWADDSAAYVGEKLIQELHGILKQQLGKLQHSLIVTGTSVQDITNRYHQMMNGLIDIGQFDKETKADNSKFYDLDLSIGVHHLLRQEFGEVTEDKHEKAIQQWADGAKAVLEIIDFAYLDEDKDKDKLADLKAKYPKPPKHLPELMTVYLRHECVQARSFLAFLLSFKDLFGLNEVSQEAIAKMIVDCDAMHKKEIPPSFVEFPGQKGEPVMPGTFPEDVVEEVAAENFVIEPLYALRFPDPEPDADAPTPYAPRPTRTSKKPKGIVRRPRQYFPENPRTPMPGDMPRRPRLKFDKKIVSTKPIGTLRERYGVRKAPSAKTRELWSGWWSLLLENAPGMPRLLGNIQLLMNRVPTGRPDDQTMEQAGGWGTEVDPVTGESVSRRPHTKLDVFLDETSREILQQATKGTAKDTPKEVPVTEPAPMPEIDEAPEEPPTPTTAWIRNQLTSMGGDRTKLAEVRPSRILRLRNPEVPPEKPVKTAEEKQRDLDLMLHDLEIDKEGEVVHRPSLFPEADLIISAKKLSDLELSRQIRKEAQEAAERKRVEVARQLAEEKRLREEEERRKRDEDRRRREEAERREKELGPVREAARRLAQLGLRQPMKPIISSLPAEWQTRVTAARDANPNVHLVKTGDGTPLTKRDFAEKLLPEQAWLNDNIVNGSFLHVRDWVNQRAPQAENPPCAAMSTYFWPHLRDKGAAQCFRMAKRLGVRPDNFETLKTILIPICKGAHWTLAVVFPQLKAVTHMDSFRRGHGEAYVHTAILSWVKVMMGDKYKEDEWVALNIDAPQQTNGYDCGVFAITNSLCIALGLDPKLSYSEMQLATQRKQLAAILLNGGFKGDFDLTDL